MSVEATPLGAASRIGRARTATGSLALAGTASGVADKRAVGSERLVVRDRRRREPVALRPDGVCRTRSKRSRPNARPRSCSPRRGTSGTRRASSSGWACLCSPRCPTPPCTSWTRTASPPSRPGDGSPDLVWLLRENKGEARPYSPGDQLPHVAQVFPGHKQNDTVLWVESQRAVISEDTLVDFARDSRSTRVGSVPA